MVEKLVQIYLRNRLLLLMAALGLFAWGIYSVRNNPIGVIPDLLENQMTFPLAAGGGNQSGGTKCTVVKTEFEIMISFKQNDGLSC